MAGSSPAMTMLGELREIRYLSLPPLPEGVGRRAFHRLIDDEAMLQRRKGALAAVGALAEAATDADLRCGFAMRQIEAVGVDELGRARDIAAKANREMRHGRVKASGLMIERARDRKEGGAIGETRDLAANKAGRGEGLVHDEARARAAEAREMK